MIRKKENRGAATLLYVSLIAVIAVLLLTLSYSRMLLALKRGGSLGDATITSNKAETEINDVIARIVGGYIGQEQIVQTYPIGDGTYVQIFGDVDDVTNDYVLQITTKRAFAVSKLKATIETTGEHTVISEDADIFLMLDCTGSMSWVSTGEERVPEADETSRVEELERATIEFLESFRGKSGYRIGIGVFGVYADWLRAPDGREAEIGSSLTLDELINAVRVGFGRHTYTVSESPACAGVDGSATSMGSGYSFVNQFYRSVAPDPDISRFEVLISDGVPNRSISYANCPGLGLYDGIEFVSCTLADSNTQWRPGAYGDRDPEVTAYTITILTDPPGNLEDVLNMYSNGGYYNITNAANLGDVFGEIGSEISEVARRVTIEKVIPSQ